MIRLNSDYHLSHPIPPFSLSLSLSPSVSLFLLFIWFFLFRSLWSAHGPRMNTYCFLSNLLNFPLSPSLAQKYDAFLASEVLMKQMLRLLGPGLSKAGKFPLPVTHNDNITEKCNEIKATIKFQLKKVLCLGVATGHVDMTEDELLANTMLSINFLVSLLKKNWQNVKSLYLKSSMGKPLRLY